MLMMVMVMVMVMVVMAMEISKVGVGNVSIGGDGGVDSYGGDGGKDGTFCTMVLMLCCSFEEWYGSPMASLDFNTFLKLVPFSENYNFFSFDSMSQPAISPEEYHSKMIVSRNPFQVSSQNL